MGGKGRGIFRDFKLSRVRLANNQTPRLNKVANSEPPVQLQNAGFGGQPSWCEEGQLVKTTTKSLYNIRGHTYSKWTLGSLYLIVMNSMYDIRCCMVERKARLKEVCMVGLH